MKKLFTAIFGLLIISSTCFAIKTSELKRGRMAVYEWMDGYGTPSNLSKRKFLRLYSSNDVTIPNDLLPIIANTRSELAVDEYFEQYNSKISSKYYMYDSISDFKIESERIPSNKVFECVVSFKRFVKFVEIDDGSFSKNRHEYPYIGIKMTATLLYQCNKEEIHCTNIKTDDFIDANKIKVFYDTTANPVNRYITDSIERQYADGDVLCRVIRTTDTFDDNFVTFKKEYLKRNIHANFSMLANSATATLVENANLMFNMKTGTNYAVGLGYGWQKQCSTKQRFGIELELNYRRTEMPLFGAYRDEYDAIDPDGSPYLRRIKVCNLAENIVYHSADVSLALRYDHFIMKRVSVFGRLGFGASLNFLQKSNYAATVEYAGYYDWLFDVTIKQNGIYDFGTYDLDGKLSLNPATAIGFKALAGLGIQCFITNVWSLELGIQYDINYSIRTKDTGAFHLTRNMDDFTSASSAFKSLMLNQVGFRLQVNKYF